MSSALSVSPLTSCSSVLKKTLEPSLEAPTKATSKAPLPLICALGDLGRRPPGALVDVLGAVGVAADQLLVGGEEDLRAVARGAARRGVEGAVAVDLALGDLGRRPPGALVDVTGAVGVAADQLLVGVEEDPRAVAGGAVEDGVEGAVAVDLALGDQGRRPPGALVDVMELSVSPLTSCSSVVKKTFEPSLEAPPKYERCGARRGRDQPQTEHGRDRQDPGGRIAPRRPRTKLMSRHKPSLPTGCSALPLGPSTRQRYQPSRGGQRPSESSMAARSATSGSRSPRAPALTGTSAVLVPVSAHIRAHRRTSAHIRCARTTPIRA